jgi:hypothetical protein
MHPPTIIEVPKFVLQVLNNLCDIERKITLHGDPGNVKRNVERIKETFEDERVFYEDPMGQSFTETRTDLTATITGEGADNLKVVEVIKPIIRVGDKSFSRVVQKGIVIVQSDVAEK